MEQNRERMAIVGPAGFQALTISSKMEGLRLRSFRKGDEEDLAKHANNPLIAAAIRDSFPNPYTLKDAENWIEFCRAEANGANYYRSITLDDHVIGGIGAIRSLDVYRYNAEVGYWLGEYYWGRGYATFALQQMTEALFAETDLYRLYAGVFSFNQASMRVLIKAGFYLEAIHKQAIHKKGHFWDEHYFVKFRS
jgi:[ribosomal protein S5]-alanine N-acetyltransferase